MAYDEIEFAVPNLELSEAEGRGVINKVTYRLASAKESDRFRMVVTIGFLLRTIDDARRVENQYPGATKLFLKANGEGSDGKRSSDWTPADPDAHLLVSSIDRGRVVYDSGCTLKKGRVVISQKAAFVEQQYELPTVELKGASGLLEFFGDPVDIEVKRKQQGLFGAGTDDDGDDDVGELPPEAGDGENPVPEAGNLVTVNYEGELIYGVADTIDDGIITMHPLGDRNDLAYPVEAVEAVVPICGKGGGAPKTVIKNYVAACGKADIKPSAKHLIVAIGQAVGRGLIERRDEGFPVTGEVIDLAIKIAQDGPQLAIVSNGA